MATDSRWRSDASVPDTAIKNSWSEAVKVRRPRWSRLALVAVLLLLIVPPALVEIAPDAPRTVALQPAPAGPYRVYVADWGYHTSVIFQQASGWRLGSLGSEGATFVEFAWGDRRFYMESNYRPDAVFATLLLPTESVAYVQTWSSDPAQVAQPRALYEREVDAPTVTALAAALEGTIRRTPGGERPLPFSAVPGYPGRFYPAHGRYLWWSDCNRWTVDRLASAHLARGGRGVFFSGQVAGRLIGFHQIGRR
jgi:hypothetical protein